MKNRIITTSIREIKSSFKRFLSLFVLSMLGVGTFVGISKANPDMMASLDKYYDINNVYDIKVLSTLGITDNDIKEIKKIKGVKNVYGAYSKDVLIKNKETEYVVKVIGLNDDFNKVKIIKGHKPKNNNEIVVEEEFLKNANLKIGNEITLDDVDDTFLNDNLKIVGIVKSSLYITNVGATLNRGTTTIGAGKVNFYTYVSNNLFDLDCYTEMYITVSGSKKYVTNTKKYKNTVDKVYKKIEKVKLERENERYNELYNTAKEEIDKKKQENLVKLNNAKNELDSAKIKLNNGKLELNNGNKTLNISKNTLDNSKKELDSYKNILDDSKEKLNEGKNKIDESQKLIEEKLSKFNLTYDEVLNIINNSDDEILDTKKEIVNNFIDKIITEEEKEKIKYIINNPDDVNFIIDNIKENEDKIKEKFSDFDSACINKIIEFFKDENNVNEIKYVIENRDSIISELLDSVKKLEEGKKEYQINLDKYNIGYEEYNKNLAIYNNYYNEYENGRSKYNNSLKIYNNSLSIYNSGLNEYYKSKDLFNTKIREAEMKLNEIPKCTWYLYDRLDDSSYSSFIDDATSVSNLSKIFPTIFFVVAVLISLISMSRMVEDDRMLIGTLKSLGFKNKNIRKKYIIYSSLATILGGITGALLGFFILPRIIWEIYKIIFDIPVFKYDYNIDNAVIGIIISSLCICGATLITIRKVIKEKTADLLRPKSPPSGKRVILEKVSFIWNRLNFSKKVTVRNLFRYKKRALMSIIGITGCTALMLVGFGIKDSIKDIANTQYKKVFHFDEMVYLKDDTNDNDIDLIFNNDRIKNYVKSNMDLSISKDKYALNLFVFDDEKEIDKIINLVDVKTKEKIYLKDNEIIITDKLASLTNTKKNDYFTFNNAENKKFKFKVSNISENYAAHYIFMNKNTYEKYFKEYKTNVVYINLNNFKDEDKVINDLMNNNNIMSVLSVNSTVKGIDDMLKSLNSVVLILIILSGSLSIVVLYNLSYINIVERKREIATLKVLGFTNKEVDNYITKETIILTIIGIIFGLIFGKILTGLIISTVEIDMVRFMHIITIKSYIISIIFIILFTSIVNFVIHFALKKIDMIESLKSVE